MRSQCACTAVRKASRALFRLYESALSETGVSITQYSILRELERAGPRPLTELAQALVMERTSLYRNIRPLTTNGAVELQSGTNRRVKVARLTRRGRQMIEQARPAWAEVQNRVVDAIGEDTWREVSAILVGLPSLIESQTR